jgi:dihydrofolate reductase
MGNLIHSMLVSLDGFVETPERSLDWAIADEELHTFVSVQARELGAFLYGRRLYELMAGFWPTADADPAVPAHIAEFARIWREKPKVVFSKTLSQVEWNSRLVRENAAEEVAKLKARSDNDMDLGGPTIAGTLMKLDLIDEYQLFVHPVVLGGGTPFFPALDARIKLRLVETQAFGSGVVYLRYLRADDE